MLRNEKFVCFLPPMEPTRKRPPKGDEEKRTFCGCESSWDSIPPPLRIWNVLLRILLCTKSPANSPLSLEDN
ncbi:hypothetical protein JTE90_023143 [Oedothorax gibbosus]|uniref:Uncharacterized protein n=1 Tax=Oedothorax gibbosus TaxID=931172 RepID=A0AAV6UPP4_9ARAC|nr:hypothetical protein JTE90_023143 [Oedothorax gibbosus]